MKIGIAKEHIAGERRVALVPDSVVALKKMGLEVLMESRAGAGAFFEDANYEKSGAQMTFDWAAAASAGRRSCMQVVFFETARLPYELDRRLRLQVLDQ